MALNDKDKEFIKKTVDDAISKSDKANERKMSDAIKSNNAKQETQAKKDRQETLEYLNKVGVLTLAEKIELLKNNLTKEIKETVKEAVPEDLSKNLKETFKTSGSNIGKGLKQGTDSIKSLMRGDILGGMSSALSGSINAGIGLAQGATGIVGGAVSAAGAVGSIISAKSKMAQAKKKKLKANEDGSFTELGAVKDEAPKQTALENTTKIIESQQTKVVEQSEEKTTTGILKKGLGGLSKGLEAANVLLTGLAAKQKIILSSIGLGVVGILALVGWFENGGMAKMLKQHLNPKSGSNSSEGKWDNAAFENFKYTQNAVISDNKEIKKQLQNTDATKFNKISRPRKIEFNNMQELTQSIGISNSDIDEFWTQNKGKNVQIADNTEPVALFFPFDIKITKVVGSINENSKYVSLELQRLSLKKNPTIQITKVIQQLWPVSTKVPKNTPIAIVDKNYAIVGDWRKFVQNEQEFIDNLKTNKQQAIENYDTNRTKEIQEEHLKSATKQAEKMYNAQFKHGDNLLENWTDQYVSEKIDGGKPEFNQELFKTDNSNFTEETPSVSIKETTANTEAAQNNIQKIKEIEKKQEQQNKATETNATKGPTTSPQANISVTNEISGNDVYSNKLRPDQLILTTNNPLNI